MCGMLAVPVHSWRILFLVTFSSKQKKPVRIKGTFHKYNILLIGHIFKSSYKIHTHKKSQLHVPTCINQIQCITTVTPL